MEEKKVIEVEVLNFFKGSMRPLNDQRFFLAVERGPGVYRVHDGTYDFTFTERELVDKEWIRRVDG